VSVTKDQLPAQPATAVGTTTGGEFVNHVRAHALVDTYYAMADDGRIRASTYGDGRTHVRR
jgi:hypothetical protein